MVTGRRALPRDPTAGAGAGRDLEDTATGHLLGRLLGTQRRSGRQSVCGHVSRT